MCHLWKAINDDRKKSCELFRGRISIGNVGTRTQKSKMSTSKRKSSVFLRTLTLFPASIRSRRFLNLIGARAHSRTPHVVLYTEVRMRVTLSPYSSFSFYYYYYRKFCVFCPLRFSFLFVAQSCVNDASRAHSPPARTHTRHKLTIPPYKNRPILFLSIFSKRISDEM